MWEIAVSDHTHHLAKLNLYRRRDGYHLLYYISLDAISVIVRYLNRIRRVLNQQEATVFQFLITKFLKYSEAENSSA